MTNLITTPKTGDSKLLLNVLRFLLGVTILAGVIGVYSLTSRNPAPTPELLARIERIKQDFARGGVEVGTILTLRRGGYAVVTHTPKRQLLHAVAIKSSDSNIFIMIIETDNSPWFVEITDIVRPNDRSYAEVREAMLPASGR